MGLSSPFSFTFQFHISEFYGGKIPQQELEHFDILSHDVASRFNVCPVSLLSTCSLCYESLVVRSRLAATCSEDLPPDSLGQPSGMDGGKAGGSARV